MDWHMCDQAPSRSWSTSKLHEEVARIPMVSRGGALEDSLDLGTPPILESILPPHRLAFPTTSFPAPDTFRFCILGQCLSQKTLNTEVQSPLPGSSKPHIAQLRDSLRLVHFCLSFPWAQPLISPLEGIEEGIEGMCCCCSFSSSSSSISC